MKTWIVAENGHIVSVLQTYEGNFFLSSFGTLSKISEDYANELIRKTNI